MPHARQPPGVEAGSLSVSHLQWEHIQPLTKYAMYGLGEQVHVASWPSFCLYRGGAYALGKEVNMAASQVYAGEGGAFVLAATTVTGPAGMELFDQSAGQRALLGGGGGGCSRVYGPDGRVLTEPIPEDQEGIAYAEIDLSLIPMSKMAADPTGHYARADVTRLIVDHTPRRAVEYRDVPERAAGTPAPTVVAEQAGHHEAIA